MNKSKFRKAEREFSRGFLSAVHNVRLLEGQTRTKIFSLGYEAGLPLLKERLDRRTELREADAAFHAGTITDDQRNAIYGTRKAA